ncbi:MAG: AMP-binding protein, partial [Gammaproteobacteria bacterium]|nr:AMP-binding protein [Gammaproteobacteria bacterium]
HYSYGLSILNSHLLSGATLLLTDEPVTSRKFWDFFKTHDATSFGGVPYTYEMLSRLRFERMSLPSLRYMTQAGGKLDVNLVKSFAQVAADMGCKFYVMYGQTEATARISYLSSELVSDNPSSIGVAIPGGKVWIEDADHQLIDSAGIEGDLVYQGDNVMMGYAESRKDLALGDELKGILRTGDIAKKDEQGLYYIVGRSKRFIKIFGNRVNLEDIELQLKKMNFDCVCGGIDNDLKVACLLGNDVNKIKQYIVEQYKFHHSVVDVRKVKEFTKNSSGKILYQEIFSNWELT